jgi:hypothetical protein
MSGKETLYNSNQLLWNTVTDRFHRCLVIIAPHGRASVHPFDTFDTGLMSTDAPVSPIQMLRSESSYIGDNLAALHSHAHF